MNLINKQDTWHEFCNTLIDISVDDFVDLSSEFISDFCLFRFHNLAHQTHEIISTLRPSVSHIEIMKCNVLNNLLLLMNITFGEWYVLFSFKIVFTGICITSSNPLYISCWGFNVNDIADWAFFSGQIFMDRRIQFKLFCTLWSLEGYYNAGYNFVSWS